MAHTLPKKNNCCGCSACSNICHTGAIVMREDAEGFCYPVIDSEKCVDCGLCVKSCPVLQNISVDGNPRVEAAYCIDEEIRELSSSGGIFTLLATTVLKNNGVVFGAALSKDNKSVSLCMVDTVEGLAELRGSKYVQSNALYAYRDVKKVLDGGREVLFSSTPCQVSGLTAFLAKTYPNLLTVDFICHGVPSPAVWREHLDTLEKEYQSSAVAASFRDKNKGWKQYSLKIAFENGKIFRKSIYEDVFLRGFNANLFLRPSCYHCSFKGNHHVSDITIADFWGIESVFSEWNDDRGTSMIIIHSSTGQQLWGRVSPQTVHKESDMEAVIRYNRSYSQSAHYHPKRKAFFRRFGKIKLDRLVHHYCDYTFLRRCVGKIKRMIGERKS